MFLLLWNLMSTVEVVAGRGRCQARVEGWTAVADSLIVLAPRSRKSPKYIAMGSSCTSRSDALTEPRPTPERLEACLVERPALLARPAVRGHPSGQRR